MWNDRETEVDLLGHERISNTIIELIHDPSLSPLTLGVYGHWGAGKSSILKMIETTFRDDDKTCCLTFNGWLFQGYEDTKSILMESIITEIQQQQPTNEVLKKKAKELLKRVDWLRIAKRTGGLIFSTIAGVPDITLFSEIGDKIKEFAAKPSNSISASDITNFVNTVKPYVKEGEEKSISHEIHEFRKEFEALLNTAKIDKLVVLVDDLDRCLPEAAIDTLEAIRLFLFVPKTVFIISADDEIIAYAVRKHFPDLPVTIGHTDYSRNYLEKLIQVPFRIPPLGKTEARSYITLLLIELALINERSNFEKILEKAKTFFTKPWEAESLNEATVKEALGEIPEKLKEVLLLSERISIPLAEGVHGNPRQIKRFLNTFMVRKRIAKACGINAIIDDFVLAKLMLLERFNELAYRGLLRFSAKSDDGKVEQLQLLEKLAKAKKIDFDTKEVGTLLEELPKEWSDDEWLITWALIEPSLESIDLRPYIYISREKSAGFVTGSGLDNELNEIVHSLLSESDAVISAVKSKIRVLSPEDASKIFKHLVYKVKHATNWKTKPQGMNGLYAICKEHYELQEPLIELFENMPIKELGAWATTGLKPILKEDQVIERHQKLMECWKNQDDNKSLQLAAKKLGTI